MAERKLFKIPPSGDDADSDEDANAMERAPLGGTKAEAMQRLQIGIFGLVAMILVVGIATAITNRAQVVEARSVPDAAPTTEPTETATQSDPLVDAGVVPDIPDEPEEIPDVEPTTVPDIDPTGGSGGNDAGDGTKQP